MVYFETHEDGSLSVSIYTERLYLQSLNYEHCANYSRLFGDAEVMGKFMTGQPWPENVTHERINAWINRWAENDPFSALAVTKNDDDAFLGNVVLGHGGQLGQSELAYAFNKSYWKQGYGKEAVSSVVNEYAPELVSRHYKVDGVLFESITATARDDNLASCKILEQVGMEHVKDEVRHGHNRHVFFKSVAANITENKQLQKFSHSVVPIQ